VVSTDCALAIHTALEELARQPLFDSPDKNLRQFLREEFTGVRCDIRDDEAHINLVGANVTRGGGIYYRIGLARLDIRETRQER